MRQIVLDTETTGLEPARGHRIIEIGCVELINRRCTGRHFHQYLNPERDIEAAALAVHGLSAEKLADQPRFADIAAAFVEFVGASELIIHNAPFDIAFLDAELARLALAVPIRMGERCAVLDTLALARELHPGQRNSLDALCRRYGVDNSRRELHGALLDARILADVYLAMTGGQSALALEAGARHRDAGGRAPLARPAAPLRVQYASPEELAAHAQLLELLEKSSGGRCAWRALAAGEDPENQVATSA
ncbi:MAG: DNA polymerase III subunit epsilon [Gammaproteobacteria bacterium]|nr:DNA polymerase III subunit epsilon [Gammaproteobacteria bacterium]